MVRRATVPFTDYLEAKVQLDTESLHPATFTQFLDAVDSAGTATIVDLGTGTGAMVRRIASRSSAQYLRFVGIDTDEAGLAIARERVAGRSVGSAGCHIDIAFLRGDLLAPQTQHRMNAVRPSAVTAHALMDCLPLELALPPIADCLSPGGHFYASLNYDGRTDFFPSYRDPSLEEEILRLYDASMDERLIRGRPIAGSRSGRRLYDSLHSFGLSPVSVGASDWSLSPERGAYRAYVRTILWSLVGMIYSEMATHHDSGRTQIELASIDRWYDDRRSQIEDCRLAGVVHHTDVLARASSPGDEL